MSGRQYSPAQRAVRGAVATGAGVAGLVSVFAFAPLADAAPAPADTTQRVPAAEETSGSTAPVEDVTPDYGYQKYRVGVRGKTGAYFPPGTSTAGTVLHVVETKANGTVDRQFDCTVANSPDVVTDATFCPGERNRFIPDLRRAASVNESSPEDAENAYYPDKGVTVTVTQKTVQAGLLVDSSTATLGPCEVGPNPYLDRCGTNYSEVNADYSMTGTDLVMIDPGIPPAAKDDSATTTEGVAVTVDIKANDTANAPVTKVELVGAAKHGTASLVTAESADPTPTTSAPSTTAASSSVPVPSITTITLGNVSVLRAPATRSLAAVTSYLAKYTPAAGFTGVDTFDYRITTANGTANATVTVTVTGSGVDASETTSNGVDASTDSRNLADTGTQSDDLLGWGVGLLAVGGAALAAGVQRRRGRHAR